MKSSSGGLVSSDLFLIIPPALLLLALVSLRNRDLDRQLDARILHAIKVCTKGTGIRAEAMRMRLGLFGWRQSENHIQARIRSLQRRRLIRRRKPDNLCTIRKSGLRHLESVAQDPSQQAWLEEIPWT